MRYFYVVVLALVVAVIALFAVQNMQTVTVSFLNWGLKLPLAFVIVGVYFLGMASGGGLLAFLRRSLRGAQKKPSPSGSDGHIDRKDK